MTADLMPFHLGYTFVLLSEFCSYCKESSMVLFNYFIIYLRIWNDCDFIDVMIHLYIYIISRQSV